MSQQHPTPTTGEAVAAWLERLAAQLRDLPEGTPPLSVDVSVQPWRRDLGSDGSTVHAVAATLGLTAGPRRMSNGTWHLDARQSAGWADCLLRIATFCAIPAPDGGADDE